MRARIWIAASVALNFLLLGIWLRTASPPAEMPSAVTQSAAPAPKSILRTNVVLRRQNFTWEQVESDNYSTYIRNLREIGCPEATIRDIIVADVDQLYAHKRVSEIVSADHQWWRSEPDLDVTEAAAERLTALDAERRALLTRLLGPDWETAMNPIPPATRTGVSLSGPVLGGVPSATKQAVYDITAHAQEKMEAYMQNQEQLGRDLDPQELARMRQQTRTELAGVLNAEQMEEFLLRYSKTAMDLREQLRGMEVSSNEFRALFKARDPIDQQLDLSYAGSAAGTVKERQGLEGQRELALKQVLGAERYENFRLNQDPVYRQTATTAEQAGIPAESVLPVYQITQLGARTATRIQNDTNLSEAEKAAALQAVREEEQKSLEKLLGTAGLQRFQQQQQTRVTPEP